MFTLKNTGNNLRKSWTQLVEGETVEDLFDCVYGAVEMHKIDVWYKILIKSLRLIILLCFR